MAKMVGFARTLKLAWLDKTVELVRAGLSKEETGKELNEYLSFEIDAKDNIRKVRCILINIWADVDEKNIDIRNLALELCDKYPDYRLELHWGMMLLAYPVFKDLCKLVGRTSEFKDEISLKQVKNRLYNEWGESSTLYFSIQKLMSTLKNIDVLSLEKPGIYKLIKHKVNNNEIIDFLVCVMMRVDDGGYYSFTELSSSVYMFPFEYEVSKEFILQDKKFITNSFGGEMTISLRE